MMNIASKATHNDLKLLMLVILFLYTLTSIESGLSSPQSKLSELIWSSSFKLSSEPSIRTFLIQENGKSIFVYTGLELWELWINGYVAKIADIPLKIKKLRAESFYYKKKSGEFFVVCRSDPTLNFTGAYLFSFDISDRKVTEVMTLPDIGLGDDYTINYQFDQDYFRVAYWANNNTYYFRINLEDKKGRGFISRFPMGMTYAEVANFNDLYYAFDFRKMLVLLYNPIDNKLVWEPTEFINMPFMNSHGKTMIIDQVGSGFLINGNGQRTKIFQIKFGNEGIDSALSPDRKKVCFLSENEIMMLDVNEGQVLWRKENTIGSIRILRFDNSRIIMSDSYVIQDIQNLHAITVEGLNEWILDFSKKKKPPFDSLIRYQDLLIFIKNSTGSIKAFKVN